MRGAARTADEGRVLVLMPTAKDAERTAAVLGAAGVSNAVCSDMKDLCAKLEAGAGAVLLTEEQVLRDKERCLPAALQGQPEWSSIPLVVLSPAGADRRGVDLLAEVTANVVLIERPVRMRTLVSVVRASIRARLQQYAVRDAVTELQDAVAKLRDADRSKDEFLALLAHELRNPLAPLRNGLQVMRLAEGDPAVFGRARAMMDRQLAHMVRLVDDLLDVSRVSRNKLDLRKERVLVADVVATAVETARPLVDAAGHDLSVSLPVEPVFVDGDLTRLGQVFSNLLTNSAKYTLPGGRISLEARCVGGELVATVSDTGVGIPPEALPTVFDMFSQVDRSIERTTGGLGIGLALVRGLVAMHGGSVVAESAGEGRGSTFTVRLPLLDAGRGVPQDVPRDAAGSAPWPRRRILVVDDNRDSAESMAMMLGLLGNEVATAHDGEEGVARAEDFRPDLILMDVGMPRLNGYEAARRIRGLSWERPPLIIALTGWGQDDDRERSKAAGCDAHLVKPVTVPDLEQSLADIAGKGAAR